MHCYVTQAQTKIEPLPNNKIDMIPFDSDDEVGIQYQLKHILTMELPLELSQVQLGRHI